MSAELTQLSEFHVAYEEAAIGSMEEQDAANDLSAAVGEYVGRRGYEAWGKSAYAELTLRDRMAILLAEYDDNGLQPTDGELDVIMAVVESVAQSNAEWSESDGVPERWRYALDAERMLMGHRKGWATA